MKISKNKLTLKVPDKKYLPTIINEIRENLERMGVNGLTIDTRYDARSNVALVRFSFEGQNYEMKVDNQRDVRANLYAISRRIEYKARMHLLGIEPFELSFSPYLALENKSGVEADFSFAKASGRCYAILGLAEYDSNGTIEKRYRHLAKSYHPDLALSEETKKEFEKRMAEINEAYEEIKKERGL